MASQEAHDWWADVQDEREALGGRGRRAVAVWADDDFDLVPEHVVARRPVSDELAPRRAARYGIDPDAVDAPVRGHRFVRAPRPEAPATGRRVVVEVDEPAAIDYAEPPRGEGIIQIKGRPGERRPVPSARDRELPPRRPARTAREMVEHQPDRIMLWVTALGFLLILIAFATG